MQFMRALNQVREQVTLGDNAGSEAMGTWFLGPVAENELLLLRLITNAIRDHAEFRRDAYPGDPPWVDTSSPAYRQAAARLEAELHSLMERLSEYSIPWYSYRYHAHMNWDNALPAVAGYFGAMLYNQNNVAAEGSPVTTALELEVAADLCRMVGFPVGPEGLLGGGNAAGADTRATVHSWSHITCDGSVANIEAMWAYRNLKLYPFAVQQALEQCNCGLEFEVQLASGASRRLVELDGWELLNLTADETLDIPERLASAGILDQLPATAIDDHSVQYLGLGRYSRVFDRAHAGNGPAAGMIDRMAFLAPASHHYSLPKGATLLGLGKQNLRAIPIDASARMRLDALRIALDQCMKDRIPVAAVIAVIGSTQESAVDPLDGILQLREEHRKQGFDYAIHADAAWGGYFMSMLRTPRPDSRAFALMSSAGAGPVAEAPITGADPTKGPRGALLQMALVRKRSDAHEPAAHESVVFTPEMSMSPYTETQLQQVQRVDSVTIDPHKAGYVPYPAGALCYRDRRLPEMVRNTAPIVYHDGVHPTVGMFGIEGSRPGAAAASVWLSHRIIRPDPGGYGRILGRCLFNSKRLAGAIATMQSKYFVIATLQELTAAELQQLRSLVNLSNETLWRRLQHDAVLNDLFRRFGSDLIINTYAVNFLLDNGTPNRNPEHANTLNDRVFRRLSLEYEGDAWPGMVITGSEYDPALTGRAIVDSLRRRLGIDRDDTPMRYLLSTTANPWLTDAKGGRQNMVPLVVGHLRKAIELEAKAIRKAIRNELA